MNCTKCVSQLDAIRCSAAKYGQNWAKNLAAAEYSAAMQRDPNLSMAPAG